MGKMISCKDFGSECTFTACAETEAELFEKVLEHGRTIHGMKEFSRIFIIKCALPFKRDIAIWKMSRANMESAAVRESEEDTIPVTSNQEVAMPTVMHFEIPADNVERAKLFYSKLFGWEIKEIPRTDYWIITTRGKTGGRRHDEKAKSRADNCKLY